MVSFYEVGQIINRIPPLSMLFLYLFYLWSYCLLLRCITFKIKIKSLRYTVV